MGDNSNGQLGTGNTTNQAEPTQVVGLAAKNIVSVACSGYHTCAVNAAGAMFCWGDDYYDQLGDPSITSDSPNPVQVAGITSGAASAWTGFLNSFVLMQNDTVLAFGRDQYGVFGTGSIGNKTVPIVVWCTGYNNCGQLGVGNKLTSLILVEMQLPSLAPPAQPTVQLTATPAFEPTLVPTRAPSTSGAIALNANIGAIMAGTMALLLS
ncbi:hypothetical protein BASA82_000450 [Batrachochytrium salamandrivorans]|nr:hypothetical protein BASA82_000450 [Batrachochytrium salamandrivorans]